MLSFVLVMGILARAQGQRLTKAIIGSQQALADDMLKHRLADRDVRNGRALIRDRRGDLKHDCASDAAKATLQALAQNSFMELAAKRVTHLMFEHQAKNTPSTTQAFED